MLGLLANISKISFSNVSFTAILFFSISALSAVIFSSICLQTTRCFWTVATNLSLLVAESGALTGTGCAFLESLAFDNFSIHWPLRRRLLT